MNQTRRTLDAAIAPSLSPEAVALIKDGTPKPQTQNPIFAPAPAAKPAATVLPAATPPAETKPTQATPRLKSPTPESDLNRTLVSVNFRIPTAIQTALLKASSDRKMKKIRPFTQQDIVAEALQVWLQKNGYLPEKG